MFKIERAIVKNFGIIEDLEIDFSTDDNKPLTLVRAENGSGKTTLIRALRWGMFGDIGLPQRVSRGDFRISPNHLVPKSGSPPADVKAEVEIYFTKYTPFGEGKKFILQRRSIERVNSGGSFSVVKNELELFQDHSGQGLIPLPNPKLTVGKELLRDGLMDIFFTDNEEINAFIDRDDRKKEVRRTVESLLGINQVRALAQRVEKALASLRSEITRASPNANSVSADAQINTLRTQIADQESSLEQIASQRDQVDMQLSDLIGKRDALLQSGAGRLPEIKAKLETENKLKSRDLHDRESRIIDLSDFLSSDKVISSLCETALSQVSDKLQPMVESGQIPNYESAILRRVLQQGECICGAPAHEGSDIEKRLNTLLTNREKNDRRNQRLSELKHDIIGIQAIVQGFDLGSEITKRLGLIAKLFRNIQNNDRRIKELNAEVESIDDEGINEINTSLKRIEAIKSDLIKQSAIIENSIQTCKQDLKLKEERFNQLAKQNKKAERLVTRSLHYKKIKESLDEGLDILTTQTIAEVSQAMQESFVLMTQASDLKGYDRIYIASDYDLKIVNSDDVIIDPSRLSGAERRAFTLSFILSLVRRSGESAPLFVDTPLGFTSGMVRKGIFSHTISLSEQVVLFVTSAELNGIEDEVRESTGSYITLTNAAHYPSQLPTYLGYDYDRALVCKCSPFDPPCNICQRRS